MMAQTRKVLDRILNCNSYDQKVKNGHLWAPGQERVKANDLA